MASEPHYTYEQRKQYLKTLKIFRGYGGQTCDEKFRWAELEAKAQELDELSEAGFEGMPNA